MLLKVGIGLNVFAKEQFNIGSQHNWIQYFKISILEIWEMAKIAHLKYE